MIKFIFGCIIIPILGVFVATLVDIRGVKTHSVFYIIGYLTATIACAIVVTN